MNTTILKKTAGLAIATTMFTISMVGTMLALLSSPLPTDNSSQVSLQMRSGNPNTYRSPSSSHTRLNRVPVDAIATREEEEQTTKRKNRKSNRFGDRYPLRNAATHKGNAHSANTRRILSGSQHNRESNRVS